MKGDPELVSHGSPHRVVKPPLQKSKQQRGTTVLVWYTGTVDTPGGLLLPHSFLLQIFLQLCLGRTGGGGCRNPIP